MQNVSFWHLLTVQNLSRFGAKKIAALQKMMGSYRVVRAIKPDALDQQHLSCEPGDPVLEVEQVIYLDDGTPLEYAHCHYRYDHGGIVIVNNG